MELLLGKMNVDKESDEKSIKIRYLNARAMRAYRHKNRSKIGSRNKDK